MPWWAIAYLILFVLIFIVGTIFSRHENRMRWRILCDSVALIGFSCLFAGYWWPAIIKGLGFLAIIIFSASLSWELYDTPREIKSIISDQELSTLEKFIWGLLAGAFAIPIYIVAGMAVFRA
jgi:MFS-type transporter involved in bile tolerance (Atg22 family)